MAKVAGQHAKIINLEIQGVKELQRKLDALDKNVGKKIVRKALGKGIALIRKEAKAEERPRRRTGGLQRAIASKVKIYRRGATWAGVGVDAKKQFTDNAGRRYVPAKIAHLVEKGTRPHSILKGARTRIGRRYSRAKSLANMIGAKLRWAAGKRPQWHPGSRPYPWLNPAFLRTRERALAIIAAELRAGIEAMAKAT